MTSTTSGSASLALREFVDTCLGHAIRDLDDARLVAPTVYFREDGRCEVLVVPRDGTRVLADEQAAKLAEALRDLAIDPAIDAYCALFYAGVTKPGGRPIYYGLRVHIGERTSPTGSMRFYPVVKEGEREGEGEDGRLVVEDFLFSRPERSWFYDVTPIVESSSCLPSDDII
jgi:hypothetical protein